MPSGEWEYIDWIRRRTSAHPRLQVGIGDDVAVLKPNSRETLITVDMLVEGVHFDADCPPRLIGRKALAVNLSDIAAKAGKPTACVAAVALPTGRDGNFARELFDGMFELAQEFDVAVAGGDTNRSPAGLVISVTLLGEPTGAGPVLRSGAQVGDVLCVTGRLGYSLAGRHLTFIPRLREAQLLHSLVSLHAMMDLSDGLGSDVFHLAEQSKCGVALDAARLPIHDAPVGQADERGSIDHALNDGEDFELLFALAPRDAQRLETEQPLESLGVSVTRIGEIVEPPGVFLRHADSVKPMARGGFTHRW